MSIILSTDAVYWRLSLRRVFVVQLISRFSNLQYSYLLFFIKSDAVRRNTQTSRATDDKLEQAIMTWLRLASDRNGGRKHRAQNATVSAAPESCSGLCPPLVTSGRRLSATLSDLRSSRAPYDGRSSAELSNHRSSAASSDLQASTGSSSRHHLVLSNARDTPIFASVHRSPSTSPEQSSPSLIS